MTDLNKLRSEFELAMKSKHIIDLDFVQYHEPSNKYVIQNGLSGEDFRTALDASHVVNVAWLMFQEKAKAQAVPEGYTFINKESLLFHAQSIRMFNDGDWENHYEEIEEHVCSIEEMVKASESGAEG